jgi:hypothetical protein
MGHTACTEPQCLYSRAIPLLPLWAVQPVQSLSACTVQLYLYSSYGPYGLYRTSVPVQYSYTSAPPMGRTACTELQCLYKGVLNIFLHVSTLSCHHQGACNQYLAKLPKYFQIQLLVLQLTIKMFHICFMQVLIL